MPWKECSVMDERLRFVAQLLDGEPMAQLCRAFGISRKTGYKIFTRYKEHGLEALTDRSRRPVRYANQLPPQVESLIVSLKREKPHWGARKIRELLVRRLAGDVRIPAKSTIHAVLHRHGLVKTPGRPHQRATGTPLSTGAAPNDLWCADFKGEFKLGNGQFNLSKLSVWWLRLGIAIERIQPGHPQQNGRHERMHLTLKQETTRPPGLNSLQQQARFDAFRQEFNTERPHEALAMKCPAEVYSASTRPYDGLPDVSYPFHDRDVLVTACGRICLHRKKVNISTVLAGQRLGIKEVDDGIWIVSFMRYDLGFIDLEQRTLQPLDNPFGPGLSPMS